MEGNGARIIFKSHYVKSKHNAQGGTGRYASYIATREGAVMIETSERNKPATQNQITFVDQITKEIPSLKESASYYEYENNQTLGNAHDFITSSMDEYGYKVEGLDGYAKYMATRPGVTKLERSGLFSDVGTHPDLERTMQALKQYRGNVYMPIISLRPEDSIGLGYDNPDSWQRLITDHKDEIAREFKIPSNHFQWVGAYHNATNGEGYEHNHIHMIIWSTNPSDGWQSEKTGNNIRKILAKDIFRDELQEIYEQGTKTRNEIRAEAGQKVRTILNETSDSDFKSSELVKKELVVLSESLSKTKGRKYYAYLSDEQKQMVDNIMQDIVDGDPKLKELLNLWSDAKDRQVKIYSEGSYKLPPIASIKEFKPIKNRIINEAVAYGKSVDKLKKIETDISKIEEQEERELSYSTQRLTSSFVKSVSRTLSNPVNQKMPRKIHIKDAEDIDAQVRRSQGMH